MTCWVHALPAWATSANNLALIYAKLCRNFMYSSQIYRQIQPDRSEVPKKKMEQNISKQIRKMTEKYLRFLLNNTSCDITSECFCAQKCPD